MLFDGGPHNRARAFDPLRHQGGRLRHAGEVVAEPVLVEPGSAHHLPGPTALRGLLLRHGAICDIVRRCRPGRSQLHQGLADPLPRAREPAGDPRRRVVRWPLRLRVELCGHGLQQRRRLRSDQADWFDHRQRHRQPNHPGPKLPRVCKASRALAGEHHRRLRLGRAGDCEKLHRLRAQLLRLQAHRPGLLWLLLLQLQGVVRLHAAAGSHRGASRLWQLGHQGLRRLRSRLHPDARLRQVRHIQLLGRPQPSSGQRHPGLVLLRHVGHRVRLLGWVQHGPRPRVERRQGIRGHPHAGPRGRRPPLGRRQGVRRLDVAPG
mmetsp:Transcript_128100/g.358612  ORF Transcript_128100/g.358612 Transcript_128100/m.358612 type:complete len:320 (+) Transcript_128100:447-1406(+)